MAKSRPHTRLNSRLSAVATPVALIDKNRKVLFFNQGCEKLTGWDASLVVGSICEYTTEGDPQTLRALLGSLCPPPHVFLGNTVEAPAFVPRQAGRPIARQLRHIPLLDEAGEVDSVLVLISEFEAPPVITTISPAQRLHAELSKLRAMLRQRFGLSTIIAQSEPMLRVLQQVKLAIQGSSALVLEGEPGTGKEHIARVIHHETARLVSRETDFHPEAFVPLDCARMLPIDLKRTVRRLLQAAQDQSATPSSLPGSTPRTVYFQNVDAMPRDVQEIIVTSLDDIQEHSPVRLISGTSRDLESLVQSQEIREDFFYRISPLRIALPPLRKRPKDFELLAQAFLERFNVGAEAQMEGFSGDVWQEFREYHWPGNLDELMKVIEEARDLCEGVVVERAELPFRFSAGRDAQSVGPRAEPQPRPLEEYLEHVEREQIEWALELTRHNKKKTADLLGLTRTKLYRRMEALGIDDADQETP